MTDKIRISHVVRDKGGKSAGKTLTAEVPAFDWEQFKNAPNANEFVKRAYYASVKKLMREADEGKNGTTTSDLVSYESILTRTLHFTKQDIQDWMDSRDWKRATEARDIEKALGEIRPKLPEVALGINPFPDDYALKLANKVIAKVADVPTDPVADYIFSILTTKLARVDLLEL